MRRTRSSHIPIRSTLSLAFSAVSFVACGENATVPNAPLKYKITTSRDTIFVGELLDLVTTPVGNGSGQVCGGIMNKKLSLTSSDASILTVTSNGRALGVAPGTASVAASAPCNSMTAPKTLTVINR